MISYRRYVLPRARAGNGAVASLLAMFAVRRHWSKQALRQQGLLDDAEGNAGCVTAISVAAP